MSNSWFLCVCVCMNNFISFSSRFFYDYTHIQLNIDGSYSSSIVVYIQFFHCYDKFHLIYSIIFMHPTVLCLLNFKNLKECYSTRMNYYSENEIIYTWIYKYVSFRYLVRENHYKIRIKLMRKNIKIVSTFFFHILLHAIVLLNSIYTIQST